MMSKSRTTKVSVIIVALLLISQLIMTAVLYIKLQAETDTTLIDYTIVIDAGHGGVDGGVVGVGGTIESHLNLLYAMELKEKLEDRGFRVVATRTDSNGLYGLATNGFKRRDMEARKKIIQESNADLVLSIHMNKYSSSNRSGPQIFFQQGSIVGKQLADSVQESLNVFSGNRHQSLHGDFFICRCSQSASIIVECGFLSNAEEEKKLKEDNYRHQLVDAVLYGVMMYLYSI